MTSRICAGSAGLSSRPTAPVALMASPISVAAVNRTIGVSARTLSGMSPQLSAEHDPIHVGHVEVEQDDARRVMFEEMERLRPARRSEHREPLKF